MLRKDDSVFLHGAIANENLTLYYAAYDIPDIILYSEQKMSEILIVSQMNKKGFKSFVTANSGGVS